MKLKYIALLLILFQVICLNGQISKEMERINADSLQQVFSRLSGTEKIDTLNNIAIRVVKDHPDSCRKLAYTTISMSDSLDYQKGLALGYLNLGRSYLYKDSLFPAMINLLNSERIYEQMDSAPDLRYIYNTLAWINKFSGRFRAEIKYQRKAIKVNKQFWGNKYVEHNYSQIARAYISMGDYDSAIYYNSISLSIDSNLNTFPYNTFGIIYRKLFFKTGDTSMLERSIEWLKKGLDLPFININHHRMSALHANLFHTYYAYGNKSMDSLALYHTRQIIPHAMKTKDAIHGIPGAWIKFGKLFMRNNQYDSAIICYNKALHFVDSAQSNFTMKGYTEGYYGMQGKYYLKLRKSDAYYLLYDVYSTIGDHKKALEYYIIYKEAKEDIYREETKNLVALLEAESVDEKTQTQIAELERDKQVNELKAAQTKNLNIGIIIAFIILLFVGILFLRQNKLKNEHKSTLLEQKLLRLQMNPHFIFNALSSIHSLMNPRDVNKASDYLGNFSRLLRSSLESSREDYILLEDEINSMKNYLELQQLRYENKFDYHLDVDKNIDLGSAILPPMLIQPFIENAIEHGIRHKEEMGNIHIRFKLNNKKITCEIEDDGVGREKAWEVEYSKMGKHKSLATEIILDRIKILNKKLKQKISLNILDLKSQTNETIGTMVRLDLPYLLD